MNNDESALSEGERKIGQLKAALRFIEAITSEELQYAQVGTGTEVALRHVNRKAKEALLTTM